MTYVVDTHVLIWFLDKNKRLKQHHCHTLVDKNNKFVISTVVLAEIKHLISRKRITLDYEKLIDYLSESENCVIYPVDEYTVEEMPEGLNIHDALIVGTGLVYKNILGEEVKIITEDEEIINSNILPVA